MIMNTDPITINGTAWAIPSRNAIIWRELEILPITFITLSFIFLVEDICFIPLKYTHVNVNLNNIKTITKWLHFYDSAYIFNLT